MIEAPTPYIVGVPSLDSLPHPVHLRIPNVTICELDQVVYTLQRSNTLHSQNHSWRLYDA